MAPRAGARPPAPAVAPALAARWEALVSATPHTLRGDEAALFARHHARLERHVAVAVAAPAAVIEDACATAWAILLRAQPRRETLFAWLRTVAIHEAWRLARQQRRDVSLDTVTDSGEGKQGTASVMADRGAALELQIEARAALQALTELPDAQREVMQRKIAGLSYREIAELSGVIRCRRRLPRGAAR